jgi:GTP pyrophosphokinase
LNELVKEGQERERYIEKVHRTLGKELAKAGITNAKLSYRIKDHYSIYRKLLSKDMDVAKIYDIYALRAIVPTVEDCYRVLGLIHGTWKPVPGRIKDYIANPKTNGYQSLHTTIFTGDGGIVEIQIRTPEMHLEAEYGIAAHLLYKPEDGTTQKNVHERLSWLSRIKELHETCGGSPADFLKNLRLDFFDKRVFVFTPRGDVVELPEGSTVLDFAFRIHSDLGMKAAGARVNGKFVALDQAVKSGDIIEIETKKSAKPSRRWLSYVKTSGAAKHIRAFIAKEEPKATN